jgi:hypothetical protein
VAIFGVIGFGYGFGIIWNWSCGGIHIPAVAAMEVVVISRNAHNKKYMSLAGGLGQKQAGGFAVVTCLFVPHI